MYSLIIILSLFSFSLSSANVEDRTTIVSFSDSTLDGIWGACAEGDSRKILEEMDKLKESFHTITLNYRDYKTAIQNSIHDRDTYGQIASVFFGDMMPEGISFSGRQCLPMYLDFFRDFRQQVTKRGSGTKRSKNNTIQQNFSQWRSCINSNYRDQVGDVAERLTACLERKVPQR